jgi:site-specific DNA recombinase
MKKCGFIVRVSTPGQARNPEGSLTNQLQRLRAHVDYKNNTCGEQWSEVDKYDFPGVSGKVSFRSKEFQRLLEDIRTGRINTVVCTALDRVCRSVKDFLSFLEILSQHGAEFVCLKQNFDTTTSHGKLFMTMMMALAEFERDQTSERNRDASLIRAERGLWNGGYLLGFDLDPDKKAYLLPNPAERVAVNFGFDKCLELGSAVGAMKALNSHGYRTKEYTSRRGKPHAAKRFSYSSTVQMLTNLAYIGKKEINKKNKGKDQEKLPESQRYRVVKARWEAIVDEEKFWKVQELLRTNYESKRNCGRPVQHNYIMNKGLMWCAKCGTQMEGTCGHGAGGAAYYYYLCKNKGCKFKVPAGEVEGVVLERIRQLSARRDVLEGIVSRTNERLKTELPALRERKDALQRELGNIKASAAGLIRDREEIAGEKGIGFVREQLDELGARRGGIETGIQETDRAIREIERESVSHREVTRALSRFSEVFGELPPYRQKELVRLVVHRVELAPDSLKMALYGRVGAMGPVSEGEGGSRSGISEWLRGSDSNH